MKPIWRRMFDTVEKAVAPGLQEVTASAAFRDVVATGSRLNASIAKEVERSSRQWLHTWNLPAAGDVRNLRRQVAALEKEIRLLRSVVIAAQASAAATASDAPSSDAAASATAASDAPSSDAAASATAASDALVASVGS